MVMPRGIAGNDDDDDDDDDDEEEEEEEDSESGVDRYSSLPVQSIHTATYRLDSHIHAKMERHTQKTPTNNNNNNKTHHLLTRSKPGTGQKCDTKEHPID